MRQVCCLAKKNLKTTNRNMMRSGIILSCDIKAVRGVSQKLVKDNDGLDD